MQPNHFDKDVHRSHIDGNIFSALCLHTYIHRKTQTSVVRSSLILIEELHFTAGLSYRIGDELSSSLVTGARIKYCNILSSTSPKVEQSVLALSNTNIKESTVIFTGS